MIKEQEYWVRMHTQASDKINEIDITYHSCITDRIKPTRRSYYIQVSAQLELWSDRDTDCDYKKDGGLLHSASFTTQ